VGFLFESGNTTGASAKGIRCCVYEKNRLSGLFPFRGRLSGDRFARRLALRARQPPDYPLASVLAHGSIPFSRPSGGLTQGMPPPNSFPLTLSSPGAFIVVLPHLFKGGVPLERYLWGVRQLSDAIHTRLESARGCLLDAVSSFPIVS
jgi:hypothetical protein